jgi:glycosyltransferase involved in cell wall biosynthesis
MHAIMNPEISIVICTYNRAALLRQCVDGIVDQSIGPERFELVVVDNNSTDNTASVISSFSDHVRNLKYVFEEVQGLSRARNRALEEASAPVVIFVDDDAIPYPDWAERFIEAFERFPDAAVIGGECEPLFESARPPWLDDDLLKYYSCGLYYSDDYHFLEDKQWLIECNSGYRVEALKAAGGFPENLGRKGNLLLSGDGAVNSVIVRSGGRMLYTPFANVRHLVPTSRLTPKWLAQRRFWGGVTRAVVEDYLKHETGETDPWRDLLLPSRVKEWEALVNLEPDENLKSHLTRISHLGYLLAKMGIITT